MGALSSESAGRDSGGKGGGEGGSEGGGEGESGVVWDEASAVVSPRCEYENN
jgi:hypothetical protein